MNKIFKIILMIIGVQITFNGFASENERRALIVHCIDQLPTILPTIHTKTVMNNFMNGFFNNANDEIKACINNSIEYYNYHKNDSPALQLNEALNTMSDITEKIGAGISIGYLKEAFEDMIFQMLLYNKDLPE